MQGNNKKRAGTCLTCHFRSMFNGKHYCSMSDWADNVLGLKEIKSDNKACAMYHKKMSLEECIANATEFWKDVDVDEYLQELRGEIDRNINSYLEKEHDGKKTKDLPS